MRAVVWLLPAILACSTPAWAGPDVVDQDAHLDPPVDGSSKRVDQLRAGAAGFEDVAQ